MCTYTWAQLDIHAHKNLHKNHYIHYIIPCVHRFHHTAIKLPPFWPFWCSPEWCYQAAKGDKAAVGAKWNLEHPTAMSFKMLGAEHNACMAMPVAARVPTVMKSGMNEAGPIAAWTHGGIPGKVHVPWFLSTGKLKLNHQWIECEDHGDTPDAPFGMY